MDAIEFGTEKKSIARASDGFRPVCEADRIEQQGRSRIFNSDRGQTTVSPAAFFELNYSVNDGGSRSKTTGKLPECNFFDPLLIRS
mmetsp:Transcript_20614/g.57211  ORF Transcript_20614/g.57211 Transcript_20614/m.57211 type:complete len:86 (+) Transcript_20614:1374-1631(+)